MVSAPALLQFWFGAEASRNSVPADVVERWRRLGVLHVPDWTPSPEADAELRLRFGDVPEAVERGDCERWLETPAGRLAYILACDQLPRSLFRGTAQALRHDARARDAAVAGLAEGALLDLGCFEQVFFLMPFVHAEDGQCQELAREHYARLRADDSAEPLLDIFRQAASRHDRLIRHFGRFPHRNPILGRADTADERSYRRDPWGWSPLAEVAWA